MANIREILKHSRKFICAQEMANIRDVSKNVREYLFCAKEEDGKYSRNTLTKISLTIIFSRF